MCDDGKKIIIIITWLKENIEYSSLCKPFTCSFFTCRHNWLVKMKVLSLLSIKITTHIMAKSLVDINYTKKMLETIITNFTTQIVKAELLELSSFQHGNGCVPHLHYPCTVIVFLYFLDVGHQTSCSGSLRLVDMWAVAHFLPGSLLSNNRIVVLFVIW